MKKITLTLLMAFSLFSFSQFNNYINADGVDDNLIFDNTEKLITNSSDFTLEFYTKICGGSYIFDNNGSTVGNGIYVSSISGGGSSSIKIFMRDNTGYSNRYLNTIPVTSDWFHFAWTYRTSDSLNNIYVDGQLVDTFIHGYEEGTDIKTICSDNSLTAFYNGQIDEFRISNNVRYSSDFTPPNQEFITDINTVLLFHMNESGQPITSFQDVSSNGYVFTPNGGINTLHPFSISQDAIVCSGQNMVLSVTGGTSYSWNTGDITQDINVASLNPTYYTVTVSNDTNSCPEIIDTVFVDVFQLPLFLGNDTTICNGETLTLDAGNYSSFLWNDMSTNQILDVSISGQYIVEVTDINTCTNTDTINVEVVTCSGINELGGNYKISIYPNPVQNNLTISSEQLVIQNIKILDITGKAVKQLTISNEQLTIDVSDLQNGIYFVKINNTKTIKFIKQ